MNQEADELMHHSGKTLALLLTPLLTFAVHAPGATLPSENVESEADEGDFADVISADERDDFEEFLREQRAEEQDESRGFDGLADESPQWDGGSGSARWSESSSAVERFGEEDSSGRAGDGFAREGVAESGFLVSDPGYSPPDDRDRPSPASSIIEEFAGIGDGLDARGGAAAEGESGGPGFDPYADPFAPSDSESPAGEERSGLSEREPSRPAIETTTWTLSPEDSESNDLAPEEPRGTRLPQSSAPGYLVD